MFTPFSPHLALWREVYVCVEQLLEWIHRVVQSAAEVCCNKSNALCKVSVEVMEGWKENGRGCWKREWSGGFGSRKGY